MKGARGVLICSALVWCPTWLFAASIAPPEAEIVPEIATRIYGGDETLSYRISWSGGIKIGELHMKLKRLPEEEDGYEIFVRVKDSGLFHFFYPVDDSFTTWGRGEWRLPTRYEVIQKEGSGYTAHRSTVYEQESGKIRFQKNDQVPIIYEVSGSVYNEFSSFFITRCLKLQQDQPQMIPTFVDGKRHEVMVQTGEEERIMGSIRGDINVLPVKPIMNFKGLYDKSGDTVIYLSNDPCRIPMRINSKIAIGSLTAELVSYENPRCIDQARYHNRIPESVSQVQELELGD
jgi:hypothetical protein